MKRTNFSSKRKYNVECLKDVNELFLVAKGYLFFVWKLQTHFGLIQWNQWDMNYGQFEDSFKICDLVFSLYYKMLGATQEIAIYIDSFQWHWIFSQHSVFFDESLDC